MRKIMSSLKTRISILTKKLTYVQILIKKLSLMKLKITTSSYRLFKAYSSSGLANDIMKYVTYTKIRSRSIIFQ
jgi:hypothetical protein